MDSRITPKNNKTMTIEEYSNLMGYKQTCTDVEYQIADFIYLMAGDMNKQDFCKEYKKTGCTPLIRALADAAHSREIAYRDKQAKEEKTARALLQKADELRTTAAGIADDIVDIADSLDDIAAGIIGRKDCIKIKINKGYVLSDTDKGYINDNL